MVVRIAILFLIAVAVFVALRLWLGKKPLTVRQFGIIYAASLLGLVLVFLGLTGRLHWLFGVLGIVLPFLLRGIPLLLQLANLRRLAGWFSSLGGPAGPSGGQTSSVHTRFLEMTLDHDSGKMDGRVLEGRFEGQTLSAMPLDDLLALLDEVRADGDSENVLRAWLDREHPEWTESGEAGAAPAFTSGNLSIKDAYDILGLSPGVSREDVRAAHRRLIKQHHPDHGGSTWLAARINEAKEILLDQLEDGS